MKTYLIETPSGVETWKCDEYEIKNGCLTLYKIVDGFEYAIISFNANSWRKITAGD